MTNVIFDNSIHLGQFAINDDHMRVAAKKFQISVAEKADKNSVALITFNENSYTDDFIWGLPREPQDIFFQFMDLFHSKKNTKRLPLCLEDSEDAATLSKTLGIHISNALTIVAAQGKDCKEIQSFYSDFSLVRSNAYLKSNNLRIADRYMAVEQVYDPSLEDCYQKTVTIFNQYKIDVVPAFHS